MLPSYPLSYQPYFLFPSLLSSGTPIVKIRQSNYIPQQSALHYSKFPTLDSIPETKFKSRRNQSLINGLHFSYKACLESLELESSLRLKFI